MAVGGTMTPPEIMTDEDDMSPFGIKKIVDCKFDQEGKQLYKVKWTETWEPAENLTTCQHLIDDFWSFINNAKTNEQIARDHRKRMKLDHCAVNNNNNNVNNNNSNNDSDSNSFNENKINIY